MHASIRNLIDNHDARNELRTFFAQNQPQIPGQPTFTQEYPNLAQLLNEDATLAQALNEQPGNLQRLIESPTQWVGTTETTPATPTDSDETDTFRTEDLDINSNNPVERAMANSGDFGIQYGDKPPKFECSAFFTDGNTIVTAAHCTKPLDAEAIASGKAHYVFRPYGGPQKGEVLQLESGATEDDSLDVSVHTLETPTDYPGIPFAPDASAEVLDVVHTIGSPAGHAGTLTTGYISSTAPLVGGTIHDVFELQVDMNIRPGNSGGALINEAGEVVGVITSGRLIWDKVYRIVLGELVPADGLITSDKAGINLATKSKDVRQIVQQHHEKREQGETDEPSDNEGVVDGYGVVHQFDADTDTTATEILDNDGRPVLRLEGDTMMWNGEDGTVITLPWKGEDGTLIEQPSNGEDGTVITQPSNGENRVITLPQDLDSITPGFQNADFESIVTSESDLPELNLNWMETQPETPSAGTSNTVIDNDFTPGESDPEDISTDGDVDVDVG